MSFIQKTINPTGGLGIDLIELREKTGLSRADISRQTKIPEYLIRALEEEEWDKIEDPVFFENIFKKYLQFFGVNKNYYLQKYRHCLQSFYKKRKHEEFLPRPCRVKKTDLAVGSHILAVIGFGCFVLLLGGYVFTQVRAVTAPPPLTLTSPSEGMTLQDPQVDIQGTTSAEATVDVNGIDAMVQPDGSFQTELDLPRGMTEVTIEAKKRHSRTATLVRHVIFDRSLPDFSGFTDTATSTTTTSTIQISNPTTTISTVSFNK